MEWFWTTVVFLWLGAMGLLFVWVIYYWAKAAADAVEQDKARWRTAEARGAGTLTMTTDERAGVT